MQHEGGSKRDNIPLRQLSNNKKIRNICQGHKGLPLQIEVRENMIDMDIANDHQSTLEHNEGLRTPSCHQ